MILFKRGLKPSENHSKYFYFIGNHAYKQYNQSRFVICLTYELVSKLDNFYIKLGTLKYLIG